MGGIAIWSMVSRRDAQAVCRPGFDVVTPTHFTKSSSLRNSTSSVTELFTCSTAKKLFKSPTPPP